MTYASNMQLANRIVLTRGLSILILSLCAFLAALNFVTADAAVICRQYIYCPSQTQAIAILLLQITVK